MPTEINITRFYNEAAPKDYSASVADIGNNAGMDTWRAALDDAPDYNKRDAFRAHVKGFGAWTDEEIAAWDDTALNALFIQFVSGDMRNGNTDRLYVGDDMQAYYTIGD